MRLSTKSRYSLRILVQLALEMKTTSAVKGRVIAKKQDLSEAYLEQIMIPLKSAELVRTIRGCNGGYSLNKNPEDVTILHIIELFEGKIEFAEGNGDTSTGSSLLEHCPTTDVWNHLSKTLRDEASKITLASIVDKIDGQFQEYVI